MEWTERTYDECLRRAEALLFAGQRVLVDASFRAESHRRLFLETAQRWSVPALFLLCQTEPEHARQRLQDRRGDVSDADWAVYVAAAKTWGEPGPATRRLLRHVSTDGTPPEALAVALNHLRTSQLAN